MPEQNPKGDKKKAGGKATVKEGGNHKGQGHEHKAHNNKQHNHQHHGTESEHSTSREHSSSGNMSNEKKRKSDSKQHQHQHQQQSRVKDNLPRRSFIGRLFIWVFKLLKFVAIATFGFATVQILHNCYDGGKHIPGSKPLCADLTQLSEFKSPSANFWPNLRSTYGTVYRRIDTNTRPYTQPAITWVSAQHAAFSKTQYGAQVNKYAYTVHSWVVEKLLLAQRWLSAKWAELAKWYNKTGHKYFGSIIENTRVFFKMVGEIVKDAANFLYKALLSFYHKIQDFAAVWSEKGFSNAIKTIV